MSAVTVGWSVGPGLQLLRRRRKRQKKERKKQLVNGAGSVEIMRKVRCFEADNKDSPSIHRIVLVPSVPYPHKKGLVVTLTKGRNK